MATSFYRTDEVELAAIWEKIDEIDELITMLEKQRKKLIEQECFIIKE
jgi:hypothetical protein